MTAATDTMRARAAFATGRALRFIVAGVVAFIAAMAVSMVAPIFEEKAFPVVADVYPVETVVHADGTWSLRLFFHKNRDCDLVGIDWLGLDAETGAMLPLQSVDPAEADPAIVVAPVRARRAHTANISTWFRLRSDRLVAAYEVVFTHDCGLPWLSRSEAGPFGIEGAPPRRAAQ